MVFKVMPSLASNYFPTWPWWGLNPRSWDPRCHGTRAGHNELGSGLPGPYLWRSFHVSIFRSFSLQPIGVTGEVFSNLLPREYRPVWKHSGKKIGSLKFSVQIFMYPCPIPSSISSIVPCPQLCLVFFSSETPLFYLLLKLLLQSPTER